MPNHSDRSQLQNDNNAGNPADGAGRAQFDDEFRVIFAEIFNNFDEGRFRLMVLDQITTSNIMKGRIREPCLL